MVLAVNSELARQSRKAGRSRSAGYLQWRTEFIGEPVDRVQDGPQCHFSEMGANQTIPPHFHQVDQFQVFVAGRGHIGRNAVGPVALHYADHHTAYGPIKSGAFGLSIFTIRPRSDPGSIYVDDPNHKKLLEPTQKRYLLTEGITLSTEPVLQSRDEISVETIIETESDGLSASIVRLGADKQAVGPDPRATGGQYYLLLNGSLKLEGCLYPVWSTVYVASDDASLRINAGPAGLEALILNFPHAQA